MSQPFVYPSAPPAYSPSAPAATEAPSIYDTCWDGSSTLRAPVSNFIKSANRVARAQINGDTQATCRESRPTVIHHHYHQSSWWNSPLFWMMRPTPTVINYDNRSRDERREERNRTLGIIFSIATIAMAYFVGKGLAAVGESNANLDAIREEKGTLFQYRELLDQYNVKGMQLLKIANIQEKIFRRIHQNAVINLVMTAALFSGCGLLAAGCFASSGALLGVGTVATVGSLIGIAMKYGYTSHLNAAEKDGRSLRAAIDVFKE